MAYLFKDSERAARRLEILADVFAPASRAFLQDAVKTSPQLLVDLGCGPGYTTRLLAETTHCVRAVGIDSSENFIELARQAALPHTTFLQHDVTQVPFPIAKGDLLYCRMLLTHLRDPYTVVERWGTQLQPGGLLLLEEVESIQSENQLFSAYLAIVAATLKHQANMLYIGSSLDKQAVGAGLARRLSRVYKLPVTTRQAASMFYPNIQTWKANPFVRQNYDEGMIEQMERDLHALTQAPPRSGEIEWSMRQIVYQWSAQ